MTVTAGHSEFSHLIRWRDIGTAPRTERLEAETDVRAALATRFGLIALDRLSATVTLVTAAGGVAAHGRFAAAGAQPCAVSAEPVPFTLDEDFALLFTIASEAASDEIELTVADLDVMPVDGDVLDLGEAVAQSLGLALDPYPRAPAEIRAAAAPYILSEEEAAARAAAEKAAANPFGALRR